MDATPPIPGNDATPDALRGEGIVPPQPQRDPLADLRLYRHALAQGWPVSHDLKTRATGRIGEILSNPKAGDRAWVAAVRTLVSMTTATTASIDTALRAKLQEEIEDRLAELEQWQATQQGTGTPAGISTATKTRGEIP
jgi:hypothetical protein